MFISCSNRKHSWDNFTLIIPAVSVGNVGQLAADLIVNTLDMERVGYILHPSLLPCVGNNPFAIGDGSSCQLSTSCEIYESTKLKLVVIQQRAPLIKGKSRAYTEWLSSWLNEIQFDQVVVLTSSFAYERLDQQLSGPPFRVLYTKKMEERSGEIFKSQIGWKELECRHSFPAPTPIQRENEHADNLFYMPGSGITKNLFEKCQELPVLVLMMFVSEGDNAQDAVDLVGQLNLWLKLVTQKDENAPSENVQSCSWKVPDSWRLVFGSRFDQKLFQ
ncbi:unnamed protein product [Lymnaea stagnalis]|uniref:Proteasome assembly chaperone 2 n=1 Tax=Lymnaea stagnalis TaxID=6523 RepID=A0AAV2I0L4_LYMST